MTKKLYLPLLMAMVVALFSSCSKKMGELSADYFTVTPQVLEAAVFAFTYGIGCCIIVM